MIIRDKVAVVTGASRGIGLATSRELAKRGAKVVLAARSTAELEKNSAEIPGSLAVTTDVCKPEDLENLIKKTKEKYGRIDIFINNAGQGMWSPVERIYMESYKAIMEVNVFSVVRAMQDVIPVMRDQGGGVIVNVSSMVSKNYYPGLAAYASTKYALNAISLTARTELQKDNIVVSVFHPKMTATEFGANSLGETTNLRAPHPDLPVDSAEDVAKRIADLIESEEAEAQM